MLTADRMFETKLGRVQGKSRRSAPVLEHFSIGLFHIHLVAADRMPAFRQVDADLMGAAGLEPAGEDRVPRQSLGDFDVGDRLLPDLGQLGAASTTIPPV